MKNSKDLFKELVRNITISESMDEVESIVYLVMESVLGISKTQIFAEKSVALSVVVEGALTDIVKRIKG